MPKFTLSCDDGCASDVRVAELAKKYGYDCVFYWPVEWHSLAYDMGYKPLSYEDALDISSEHEIGSHTITHRHLTKLEPNEIVDEIITSKYMLERLFNDLVITKFCPPRGYTNETIHNVIGEVYEHYRLTKGRQLVHVHPDSGANNNRPWRDCIDENTKELWMHSWELDKFNLWEEFEEVLREYADTPSTI